MGLFSRIFGSSRSKPDRPGHNVAELARRLGMTEQELRACKIGYSQFSIPKRSGGQRQIFVPQPRLMTMQKLLLRRLLARLRSHEAAHAFERGRSIVTNALPHVGRDVVLRLDLKDFFPSIRANKVESYFSAIGWDSAAAKLLTDLCTFQGFLPAGAPTSPRLSNLVHHRLDARLSALAAAMGASYTRYADDMTFSLDFANAKSPHALNSLIYAVKQIAADEGYTLHITKKLRIQHRHDRQLVSGLVVNNGVALPRQTRRWLRAVEHHVAKGIDATLSAAQLQGWRALAQMIERQSQAQ